jgi:hypothetical protein
MQIFLAFAVMPARFRFFRIQFCGSCMSISSEEVCRARKNARIYYQTMKNAAGKILLNRSASKSKAKASL